MSRESRSGENPVDFHFFFQAVKSALCANIEMQGTFGKSWIVHRELSSLGLSLETILDLEITLRFYSLW